MFGRAIYDIIKYRPVETIKTMREKKGVDSMNFFDKLCLGERGIKDVLGLFLIIGIMAGAVIANADAGMWGVAGAWNLLVSVLYILFWIVFPKLFGKSRFLMKTGYVISICTLIAAVCSSFYILASGDGIIYGIMLFLALAGLVTTVPFFGLTVFGHGMSGMFEIYYPALALFALVWVLYMRFFIKKNK